MSVASCRRRGRARRLLRRVTSLACDPPSGPPGRGALPRVSPGARAARDAGRGEVALGDATVLVAAAPARAGGLLWVSYALRPPQFVSFWRLIVASLTVATFFMIATAL